MMLLIAMINVGWQRYWSVLFLLLIGFTPFPLAAASPHAALGINTNEVMDNDASVPFVDIFKASVPFEEARPWLTKGHVRYDKDGWPSFISRGGQVGTRFLSQLPAGTLPDGLYTVLYQGNGELVYGHDAKLVRRAAGKDIIAIHAGQDRELRATLVIKKTDPKNPIRNIRILMPGGICSNNPFRRVSHAQQCRQGQFLSFERHYARILFNPDYLNYMKDFKVIRFMNMSGITRNPITTWAQRNTMTKQSWSGKTAVRGAPLEVMVELANRLGADPWFCLPHKANNAYIQQVARYVRQHLKPHLKVYVEYTNEAWNTIFTQAHYMKQRGLAMRLDRDKAKAGYKYYSLRSVQIFTLWERVFGGNQRLVRVMGGWTPYLGLTDMLLSYRDAYKKTDVVAIAPYFYPTLSTARRMQSVNALFKALYDPQEKYSIPNVIKLIEKQAQKVQQYGVKLVAYEGGQHLVDWESRSVTQNPTHLFIAANKDRRMGKAYYDLLTGWKRAGGTLFVNFSAPRTSQWFGSWGTKEYITQPTSQAPKHHALLNFMRANACWWAACASPHIARLAKPAVSPAKTQLARNTVQTTVAVNKSARLLKQAGLARKKAALERIAANRRQEILRRAAAAKKAEAIRNRERARARAFKLERAQREIKKRHEARRRKEERRLRDARRER